MTQQTKTTAFAVTALDGPGRRLVGRASCEAEDHMGDCIIARGIDTSVFLRNPVLLADHNHQFILGRVGRLWIAPTPEGEALMFEAEVLPAGTSPRIDERWAAIQGGAANGISIGFIGKEMDQRQASGGRVGVRYAKTTLLEVSSVALPACPSCLIEQRAVCPGGCACGGDDALDLDLADDVLEGLSAADVAAAVRTVVPMLVVAEIARHHDVLDLDGLDGSFDPLASDTDRRLLLEAMGVTIPVLVRQEVDRLRGRIVDD